MGGLWGGEMETYQDGRCFPAQFEFHEVRDHFCLIDPEEMVFILFLREIGISQVEKEGEHSIQKANLKQRPWSMRVWYVWRLMSY